MVRRECMIDQYIDYILDQSKQEHVALKDLAIDIVDGLIGDMER